MENVNGRDKVEAGALCERKNGRGVDTNRNWDIDWGKKEKDYDPNEEFPGKAPHSEPEVKIIHDLAKEVQPHVWLNVHSGMYALFTPYDHKPVLPNTSEAKAALRILSVINQEACKGRCVVGSGGSSVGYVLDLAPLVHHCSSCCMVCGSIPSGETLTSSILPNAHMEHIKWSSVTYTYAPHEFPCSRPPVYFGSSVQHDAVILQCMSCSVRLGHLKQVTCLFCYRYLAHGTGTDYMYEVLKVPMAYTWEIYGDNDATYDDCFKIFNPLTRSGFEVRRPARLLLQKPRLMLRWVAMVCFATEVVSAHIGCVGGLLYPSAL
jgi:hypothetical protein